MGWRRPVAGRATRTARLAGAGLVSAVASAAGLYLLLPLVARAAVHALMLAVSGCVWLAASMSSGADPWTIATAIVRAAGGALATRQASGVLLALVLLGALAFYWLQRLLGSDEESSQ
ncbi:MAG: hypothetical protein AB7Q29_00325 [Vicinamibacterales bacterium]